VLAVGAGIERGALGGADGPGHRRPVRRPPVTYPAAPAVKHGTLDLMAEQFGVTLRELRKAHGLTQREVAELLAQAMPGMRWSGQVVGQWENHDRVPAPAVVRALDAIVGADGQLTRFVPAEPETPSLVRRVEDLEARVRTLEEVIRQLGR
jgi:transcriptional regulator with XRE-family HTH domain